MVYSLYVLYGENEVEVEELMGDVSLLEHMGDAAMGALTDVIDLDVYDKYANKLKNPNSVALRGSMITDMKFSTELSMLESFTEGTNSFGKVVKMKITVKGRLYMPPAIGAVNRKKNTSKILMWANTPIPAKKANPNQQNAGGIQRANAMANVMENIGMGEDPNKKPDDLADNYYRTVVATIYSTTDKQFRAVVLKKAFVKSYEESYNSQDGDGTFTLVIQQKLDNLEDMMVQGPTYKLSALSVASKVADTAKSVASKTSKVTETVEKYTGDTAATKMIKKITGSVESTTDTFQSTIVEGDLKVETLSEKVDEHTDSIKEKYIDDTIQNKIDEAKEYLDKYNALSEEQKKILKAIPGFDELSRDKKLEYIEKFTNAGDNDDDNDKQ